MKEDRKIGWSQNKIGDGREFGKDVGEQGGGSGNMGSRTPRNS